MDEDEGFRRGLVISGGAHLALLLIALFSGQLFQSDEARAIQIAEVDIMTSAEFDAAVSTAPDAPRTEVPEIAPPEEGAADVTAPELSERPAARPTEAAVSVDATETAPDMTGVRTQVTAQVRAEAPLSPELDPEDAMPEGASLIAPEVLGPPVTEQINRSRSPTALADPSPARPAPRISSTPAPKPPTDAVEAESPSPEVAPAAEAAEVRPERPAEAPPEAATEIVPEVAEEPVAPESVAPLVSSRPLGRPQSVARAAAEPRQPQEAAAPTETAEAPRTQPETAEPSRSETPREARPAGTNRPVGPPLTTAEKDGIALPLKKTWNVGPIQGHPDFRSLIVTVRFELDQQGNVIGGLVEPVKPNPPTGAFQLAFRQARTAVLRAQPFRMPAEKYERWRVVEVTFNPSKGIGY